MNSGALKILQAGFKKTIRELFLPLFHYALTKKFLDRYFNALNSSLATYFTYRERDLSLSERPIDFPSNEFHLVKSDIGIVIQGPILHHQNFTYATILRYLNFYPGVQVVLATWKNEKIQSLVSLQNEFSNFHILQLDKPSASGPSNINYQIMSTKAGLLKTQELGVDYVIKTRTDQCLYDPFALDRLRLALKSSDEIDGIGRIVFLSLNSFVFRLYGPSDMFQFGRIDQILKYWSLPYDNRSYFIETEFPISLRDYSKNEICEVYLCANYLRSLGFKLDFTMKQNLTFFRDFFIILDASSVDLVWNKYTFSEDRWAAPSFPHKLQEWNFALWGNLNQGIDNLSNYDSFLESK
jgi:hypothetical protein